MLLRLTHLTKANLVASETPRLGPKGEQDMEPTAGHITDGYKPRPQLKISAYVEPEVKTALVIAAQSFW